MWLSRSIQTLRPAASTLLPGFFQNPNRAQLILYDQGKHVSKNPCWASRKFQHHYSTLCMQQDSLVVVCVWQFLSNTLNHILTLKQLWTEYSHVHNLTRRWSIKCKWCLNLNCTSSQAMSQSLKGEFRQKHPRHCNETLLKLCDNLSVSFWWFSGGNYGPVALFILHHSRPLLLLFGTLKGDSFLKFSLCRFNKSPVYPLQRINPGTRIIWIRWFKWFHVTYTEIEPWRAYNTEADTFQAI